ncbi:hypothetical protein [Nocardioides donggukensis]|uniref:Uncharacterized protein n=1 Tax=Nocardioides donggukensis TaxID=2774019 RepID=A0A927K4W9_9ACTN|nr:hypothetical protein [Nocardioides donggukensis]MBD8870579.1 hypothetical protein [Nocardioides donggukensis]
MTRVVLVRPWVDARAGGGCCGGEVSDGVCLEGTHDTEAVASDPVGEAYRRLRAALPDVDVQVVDAGNTAWLLPSTFRAVRRRAGVAAGLRAAVGSTTAGAVLVDGDRVGDLGDLGPDGVVAAVQRALAATG